MIDILNTTAHCGIVLAGGEGKRLESFTRRLLGRALPKQYVNFVGHRSMLEHTFHRVEGLIPSQRLFTVVSEGHLQHPEVRLQLSSRPIETVVVQPDNRETGPGVLLPLLHVHKRYPGSSVAVFPSDHFIADEKLFMAYVDMALRMVDHRPSSIVLLGVKPTALEAEYGYILPGREACHQGPWGMRKVLTFVEKPQPALVQDIVADGGLWNTLVMVFSAGTMLKLVQRAWPALYRTFAPIEKAIGTQKEVDVTREVYRKVEAVNFSRGLLESLPFSRDVDLWVLPVANAQWSDWGSEERILDTLRDAGYLERHGQVWENRISATNQQPPTRGLRRPEPPLQAKGRSSTLF